MGSKVGHVTGSAGRAGLRLSASHLGQFRLAPTCTSPIARCGALAERSNDPNQTVSDRRYLLFRRPGSAIQCVARVAELAHLCKPAAAAHLCAVEDAGQVLLREDLRDQLAAASNPRLLEDRLQVILHRVD
jgi:hypothetical protein